MRRIGVLIRSAEYRDPRFSKSQLDAIYAIAEADPQAVILGLDYALRPVVRARLGIPSQERTYAILRNGDPAEPKRGEHDRKMLRESWYGG